MGSSNGSARSRRALQITLGALSLVPALSGAVGLVKGPRALPGSTGTTDPALDSEYRVNSAFLLVTAPVIWASIPKIEHATGALRLIGAAGFLGGIGRLLSWKQVGRPHPLYVAAAVLELAGVPVLVAWQERVRRRMR
ncbi:protein of unknown function [Pseudonocardia thermophila]|jgi:hypothetical protein|uniref:DUF4345 domain-containing protein n=1 Tax=Pseudonocardia thermophila TaxID=1848 RepID=A0A1M6R7M5_PSETH|nr:DUF4345 domain-containing protein [Pseudonocardia thermophila]SHK28464.1 protein of unknown function [Pseudonocardia thermophila]